MPKAPCQKEEPMLYRYSSQLFDLRYAQKDYAADAARFMKLAESLHPRAVTILDVACGTGRHLEHLCARYHAHGLDLSTELLQIAASRLPGVSLYEGDMAEFDLGRQFDIVTCFFASIPYLATTERLQQALACMARHLAQGGILFIEPWLTPEVYRENEVVLNTRKTPEMTASWMYVMRRLGSLAVWDIHWLVGTPQEGVVHFIETEELGLFTTEDCVRAFRNAGLDVIHHPRGLHGYGAFVGRARPWSADETAAVAEALAV
jgi:SAM-dependent methyltransferase